MQRPHFLGFVTARNTQKLKNKCHLVVVTVVQYRLNDPLYASLVEAMKTAKYELTRIKEYKPTILSDAVCFVSFSCLVYGLSYKRRNTTDGGDSWCINRKLISNSQWPIFSGGAVARSSFCQIKNQPKTLLFHRFRYQNHKRISNASPTMVVQHLAGVWSGMANTQTGSGSIKRLRHIESLRDKARGPFGKLELD